MWLYHINTRWNKIRSYLSKTSQKYNIVESASFNLHICTYAQYPSNYCSQGQKQRTKLVFLISQFQKYCRIGKSHRALNFFFSVYFNKKTEKTPKASFYLPWSQAKSQYTLDDPRMCQPPTLSRIAEYETHHQRYHQIL